MAVFQKKFIEVLVCEDDNYASYPFTPNTEFADIGEFVAVKLATAKDDTTIQIRTTKGEIVVSREKG